MYSLLTFRTNAIVSLFCHPFVYKYIVMYSSPYDNIFYLQQMKRLAAL